MHQKSKLRKVRARSIRVYRVYCSLQSRGREGSCFLLYTSTYMRRFIVIHCVKHYNFMNGRITFHSKAVLKIYLFNKKSHLQLLEAFPANQGKEILWIEKINSF